MPAGEVVDQVAQRLRDGGARALRDQRGDLRAGAPGVQGAAHRRLGDPVDAGPAGRLEVGGAGQFGGRSAVGGPGTTIGEIGLDEEVVDRIGQCARGAPARRPPTARPQRAAVAGQPAGRGDAEPVGLGEDRGERRPLVARPPRLAPGQVGQHLVPGARGVGRSELGEGVQHVAAQRRAVPRSASGLSRVIIRSRSPRWPIRLGLPGHGKPGQARGRPTWWPCPPAPVVELLGRQVDRFEVVRRVQQARRDGELRDQGPPCPRRCPARGRCAAARAPRPRPSAVGPAGAPSRRRQARRPAGRPRARPSCPAGRGRPGCVRRRRSTAARRRCCRGDARAVAGRPRGAVRRSGRPARSSSPRITSATAGGVSPGRGRTTPTGGPAARRSRMSRCGWSQSAIMARTRCWSASTSATAAPACGCVAGGRPRLRSTGASEASGTWRSNVAAARPSPAGYAPSDSRTEGARCTGSAPPQTSASARSSARAS